MLWRLFSRTFTTCTAEICPSVLFGNARSYNYFNLKLSLSNTDVSLGKNWEFFDQNQYLGVVADLKSNTSGMIFHLFIFLIFGIYYTWYCKYKKVNVAQRHRQTAEGRGWKCSDPVSRTP